MENMQMRRKDRAMDEKFALQVLDNAGYATISMYDGNEPYAVPISHVRNENTIYFHCAKLGRKIDVFKKYPRVCISAVSKSEPIYDGSYTTYFQSAIFYGDAVFVEDKEEKIFALKILCEKYLPNDMQHFESAIQKSLNVTQIIKIDIQSYSSKEKKPH
ncbi:MAG: pyridoxamine 5'-phosphate oxidase family protein [Peptostreptococcaceae bacterium]|jgi:flavin-nucleotide-binding protein|nr:pyridoxamine 5'-phosphate oxidase family protein [Peptostreptococcaceae bacterium]